MQNNPAQTFSKRVIELLYWNKYLSIELFHVRSNVEAVKRGRGQAVRITMGSALFQILG